jgi:hypothetical protein
MSRGLIPEFMPHLQAGGLLAPIMERIRKDSSLCLALRGRYINVYYRGGSLLKLGLVTSGPGFTASFDPKYVGDGRPRSTPIRNATDVSGWLASVPELKKAMDLYAKKSTEREVQQFILRDNNFGAISRFTDYYVCDIEYAIPHGRFDIVAVHWPSKSAVRKEQAGRRLVLGEVKFGDAALTGTAGLREHIKAIDGYLSKPKNVRALKDDMVKVFNQKRALGFLNCRNVLGGFSDELPRLLLLLANHDPNKSKLGDLLRSLPACPHAELRIASASFLGYGLYDPAILTVDQALQRLESHT